MLRGRVGETRNELKKPVFTVHSSSFHVPSRISTSQGKQYSTNTDYMRQNGTVHLMTDPFLVKLMCYIVAWEGYFFSRNVLFLKI